MGMDTLIKQRFEEPEKKADAILAGKVKDFVDATTGRMYYKQKFPDSVIQAQ